MKELVINFIYPFCVVMITIGIWQIAIELEKIKKNYENNIGKTRR